MTRRNNSYGFPAELTKLKGVKVHLFDLNDTSIGGQQISGLILDELAADICPLVPCNAERVATLARKLRVAIEKRDDSTMDALNALAYAAAALITNDVAEQAERARLRMEFVIAFSDYSAIGAG